MAYQVAETLRTVRFSGPSQTLNRGWLPVRSKSRAKPAGCAPSPLPRSCFFILVFGDVSLWTAPQNPLLPQRPASASRRPRVRSLARSGAAPSLRPSGHGTVHASGDRIGDAVQLGFARLTWLSGTDPLRRLVTETDPTERHHILNYNWAPSKTFLQHRETSPIFLSSTRSGWIPKSSSRTPHLLRTPLRTPPPARRS